jgi:ribosome biogenesis GTPase / thiamine phosphate phosphatase
MTGTVLCGQGGVYEVETAGGVVQAVLRGRIKREERTGEKVAVGDRVEVEPVGSRERGEWVIESVHERKSVLARRAPGKAPRKKVVVANVDQVLIVFAAARPEPELRMLDRLLVLCEANELDPLIVVNKIDLVSAGEARARFSPYGTAGYRLVFTSTQTGLGIDDLRQALCGNLSALAGPSGVGKSSLLNEVQPGLGLRIGAVSGAVHKGRHTTVSARLIPLECGGYVADTPGLREVGLWGIPAEELDRCFPEFQPYLGTCRFGNSCTHTHEPGCSIREAVAKGDVTSERHESYRRMLQDEADRPAW